MRIIGESNIGPILCPDGKGFMGTTRRKKGKIVTTRSVSHHAQSLQMLELARVSANRPMLSPEVYPVIVSSSHAFTPPQWKYAGHKLKVIYYQRAMDSMGIDIGGCHIFTLNLSTPLVVRAVEDGGGFLQYIRRAVARELGRELSREV